MDLCEFPSCQRQAVQTVNGKRLCGPDGDDYRDHLSDTERRPEWTERDPGRSDGWQGQRLSGGGLGQVG